MYRSTAFVFLFLAFLSCTNAQVDLKQLQNRYGDIIFAALYSIPESKNQFLEIAGNESWGTHSPEELAESIPEDIKQNLVDSITSKNFNRSSIKRTEYWILAYYQLYSAQMLTSTEETMAAIYDQGQTQSLFRDILTNRNMDTDVHPMVVGSTLSSGETNEILYGALNVISNLEAKDQLIYFSSFYATLSDMRTNQ